MKKYIKLSILATLVFFYAVWGLNSKAPGKPIVTSGAETTKKLSKNKDISKTQTKPLTIAVEFTTHSACAHLANQQGWYQEEGLIIDNFENFITGMALAAALTQGHIDAAYTCLIPAINARANAKVPIKIVAGIHQYGYGLVVDPKRVQTIDDLKKKGIRIGCNREGSPVDALLHKMIVKYHLDKKLLLDKVRRMNPPQLLLALKMGQLDAAFICEQFPTMAKELGFKELLSASDLWPDMPGSVLVVREELIQEYPEIVQKLVKVTARATQFINAHPAEAAEIVAGELQVAGKKLFPVKAIAVAAKLVITPPVILKSLTLSLTNTTEIKATDIQQAIDTCVELGYIKEAFPAEEFIDLSFARCSAFIVLPGQAAREDNHQARGLGDGKDQSRL
ncbi:MAG: ABC transporter substrate-binding protein [Desulfobacca sp.]|nr:ABC transporter substrate-binding protein [Desulfobacca sp.]